MFFAADSFSAVVVVLAAASALVLLAMALAGLWQLRALLPVQPRALDEKLRVIIPARDEALRLPATLDALLQDRSSLLEVFVYDDGSSDGTRALASERAAQDPRVLVLVGDGEPPPGKFGKPVALSRALERADELRGRHDGLVLFLDADVLLEPNALGGLTAALQESGADALSGVPRFLCHSVVEQLLVPVLTSLVGARYRPRAVHDAASPVAFLNGQLILVKRAALDEVGGFSSVSDSVLEDVALARVLKRAGKSLRLAALWPHARTRMYTSWREIDEGFGKNAVALFGGPWRTLASAFAALTLACLPWSGLVAALVSRQLPLLVVAAGALLVALSSQAALRRALALPLWPVLVLPLAYSGAALVLVRAATKAMLRQAVTWRGRSYSASSK